jgi:hypothetical protein
VPTLLRRAVGRSVVAALSESPKREARSHRGHTAAARAEGRTRWLGRFRLVGRLRSFYAGSRRWCNSALSGASRPVEATPRPQEHCL